MRAPRSAHLLLLVVWALVMLYPDPLVLGRSIHNLRNIDIDPQAVAGVAAALPADGRAIEGAVLERLVPYSYDWHTDGVPWYFPTTAEALAQGRGDCESRALVLASILERKGIPWALYMSFDHLWVDYPGKVANRWEDQARAIGSSSGRGPFSLKWPDDLDVWQEAVLQIDMFWTPMPTGRKLLLFGGLLLLSLWNVGARRAAGERPGGVLPPVPRAPAPLTARRPATAGGAAATGRRQTWSTGGAPAATLRAPHTSTHGRTR